LTEKQFLLAYDRKRTSTLTLDEQPGAHTGTTRKYIPGYADSDIIFRAPTTGNDANDGLTEGAPKQSKASSDTAAGSTKKIRIIEAATLNESIDKPTEMKRGVSGTISSSLTAPVDTFTQAGTPGFTTELIYGVCWSPKLKIFVAVSDGGTIAYSADGNVWTMAATPSFSGTTIRGVCWSDDLSLFIAVGQSGKIAYSSDGNLWVQTTSSFGTSFIYSVVWAKSLGVFVACGESNKVGYSADGVTWTVITLALNDESLLSIAWSEALGRLVAINGESPRIYYSDNAATWNAGTITSISSGNALCYSEALGIFVGSATFSGTPKFIFSSDGITWTASTTTPASQASAIAYSAEINKFVSVHVSGIMYYSSDGDTWTAVTTEGFGASNITGIAYSPLLSKFVAVGNNAKIGYSTAFANTISAPVAGFTIQAVQYSGTITAYNCTMKQPGTTANLSLNACRVTEAGSHISSNTATSFATLFEGDRHTTCTPAAQNDIDCNLDTVGGTWYIYNASATGFERVRDCLVTDGMIANFNVTVGGRANIQGDSENILIDAEVTTDDPKFVDTTDYKLQFQTNGYARNSLAAGRSAIYFNSAGSPRDIGAWSYVESAVSYFFAKSAILYKGEITHEIEEAINEQQGDSGVVTVFSNTDRIKEILTITYGSTKEIDRAPFEYMRTIKDKGVKLIIDAEWESNSGTVTANGNHSIDADVLNVDSCIYYNGMWLTIAGVRYWIMRAAPSNTAATILVLDRPLESAVADNDVITTNYPPGVGEYQYAGLSRTVLKRAAPDGLRGWQSGLQLRFVRKYQ